MDNSEKSVIMIASTASMIWHFNKRNIKSLIQRGYRVHVAANFKEYGAMSASENENLKKWLNDNNVKWHQVDFGRRLGTISGNIKSIRQLNRFFSTNEFDFSHVHSPLGSIIGRLVSKFHKVDSIYTCHGFHFFPGGPISGWLVFYPLEWVFALLTHTVVVINSEDEMLANEMPYKRVERIFGNGTKVRQSFEVIESDKIRNRQSVRKELELCDDDFVILSVGELSVRKNHIVVLKALEVLKRQGIKPKYLIAGVGSNREYLVNKIEELGLDGQVSLLGFRTDIRNLNHASDLFVFPSLREGLGIAGLDAVSDGLYILGSKYGGIKDYVFDETIGQLIDPNDIEKLAQSIKTRIENRHQNGPISSAVKTGLLQFDEQQTDEKMRNVYRSIL